MRCKCFFMPLLSGSRGVIGTCPWRNGQGNTHHDAVRDEAAAVSFAFRANPYLLLDVEHRRCFVPAHTGSTHLGIRLGMNQAYARKI